MSEGKNIEYETLQGSSLEQVRQSIRSDLYHGHTAGLAKGYFQCNLVILQTDYADEFEQYCFLNPKPCPLIDVSLPGVPNIPILGKDIDIRTDVPSYNVYRNGELTEQVHNLKEIWNKHLVVFALGCSFTFERALIDAGIKMRHIDMNVTVPMYKTSIATKPSGAFGGGMVVSMRPIKEDALDLTFSICDKYPMAHGGPVHVGDPNEIGIKDLANPDWGETIDLQSDEIPVFWACGVTPQAAVISARPPLCITHTPGSMLITDQDEFIQKDLGEIHSRCSQLLQTHGGVQ